MPNTVKLLIVDDERIALRNLEHVMKKEGYDVTGTQSGMNALKLLDEQQFDVVLTDLRMEKVDGMQILTKSRELYPDSEVIMITGFATLDSAVDAMKPRGVLLYRQALQARRGPQGREGGRSPRSCSRRRTSTSGSSSEHYQGKVKIITQDPTMREAARDGAPDRAHGLQRADHRRERHGQGALCPVHRTSTANAPRAPSSPSTAAPSPRSCCRTSSSAMRKARSPAPMAMKKGLIEMASAGTLFLDEITEMPPSMQVKLLRVIQEKEMLRVGGTEAIKVDVRFVAATNRNIQDAIKEGSFRQDLYFRLNVVSLRIPPLSERKDDIPLLSYYFLKKYAVLMKKSVSEISQDVIGLLMNYDFPGNVRELENIMERGVALASGKVIELAHLPEDLRELSIKTFRKKEGKIPSLDEQEEAYIKWVLNEVGGNKTLAAQILGIDRVSLWRKLKKYGLEVE